MREIKIRGSLNTYSPQHDWSEYFVEVRNRRGKYEFYFQDSKQGYFCVRRDSIVEAEQHAYELCLQFEACNEEHDWERSHSHNKSSQFGNCKKCFVTRNYVFEPETKCLICNDVAHFHLSMNVENKDEDYCSTHYFDALNKILSLEKDKELNYETFNYEPFDKFYYKTLKQELEVFNTGLLADKTESELILFFSGNLSKFRHFVDNYIMFTLNLESLMNRILWQIQDAIEPKFTKELVHLYLQKNNLLSKNFPVDNKNLNEVILSIYTKEYQG